MSNAKSQNSLSPRAYFRSQLYVLIHARAPKFDMLDSEICISFYILHSTFCIEKMALPAGTLTCIPDVRSVALW